MVKTITKVNALEHVRFEGRPTNTEPCLQEQTKSFLPVDCCALAHRSERAGQFISWLFQRAGLAADSYRGEQLERRLPACLRALHTETEELAHQLLEQRPDLLPAAISALLIGVTEFFRDLSVFETLRTEVLPQLTSPNRPLRVWSAGCSNGAELYSMAILLAKCGCLEGSFLLGSDCRCDAIEDVRAGLYNSSELRMIEPADRHKFFEEVGSFWQPIEPLRRHMHWKVADLVRGVEEGPWDVILWRNMSIYLTVETAESVWRGLASALAPEGVLIVGKADRPPAELPLINVRRCIYRSCSCVGDRAHGILPQ
jgi:chemotaxis protein methyltransferase CheR